MVMEREVGNYGHKVLHMSELSRYAVNGEALTEKDKEHLVHEELRLNLQGKHVWEANQEIASMLRHNLGLFIAGGDIAAEDLPVYAELQPTGEIEEGYVMSSEDRGFLKAWQKKSTEINDENFEKVAEMIVKMAEEGEQGTKIEALMTLKKGDQERLSESMRQRIEKVTEDLENIIIDEINKNGVDEGDIYFLYRGEVLPNLARVILEKYKELLKDDENLIAYQLIDQVDRVWRCPGIKEIYEGELTKIKGAVQFMVEVREKNNDEWYDSSFRKELQENAAKTIREHILNYSEKLESSESFAGVFPEINEVTREKLREELREMKESGNEVQAGIWLTLLRKLSDEEDELRIDMLLQVFDKQVEDLPQIIGDEKAVRILNILFRNKVRFGGVIAMVLSQMDARNFPKAMNQKIDSMSMGSQIDLEATYHRWYLCWEAEEMFSRSFYSEKVMLVNGNILVKFEGKMVGICLSSASLANNGKTFLEGAFYSPANIQLRDELKRRYMMGEKVVNIPEGVWVVMREVKGGRIEGERVSKRKMMERARLAAEKCKQTKEVREGQRQRISDVDELEEAD